MEYDTIPTPHEINLEEEIARDEALSEQLMQQIKAHIGALIELASAIDNTDDKVVCVEMEELFKAYLPTMQTYVGVFYELNEEVSARMLVCCVRGMLSPAILSKAARMLSKEELEHLYQASVLASKLAKYDQHMNEVFLIE